MTASEQCELEREFARKTAEHLEALAADWREAGFPQKADAVREAAQSIRSRAEL